MSVAGNLRPAGQTEQQFQSLIKLTLLVPNFNLSPDIAQSNSISFMQKSIILSSFLFVCCIHSKSFSPWPKQPQLRDRIAWLPCQMGFFLCSIVHTIDVFQRCVHSMSVVTISSRSGLWAPFSITISTPYNQTIWKDLFSFYCKEGKLKSSEPSVSRCSGVQCFTVSIKREVYCPCQCFTSWWENKKSDYLPFKFGSGHPRR